MKGKMNRRSTLKFNIFIFSSFLYQSSVMWTFTNHKLLLAGATSVTIEVFNYFQVMIYQVTVDHILQIWDVSISYTKYITFTPSENGICITLMLHGNFNFKDLHLNILQQQTVTIILTIVDISVITSNIYKPKLSIQNE